MTKCLFFVDKITKVVFFSMNHENITKFMDNLSLHDFLSALRVRFRSRGAVLGVEVAVFTNDSNISSSPSVNVSSDIFNAGERCTSGRLRLNPIY